MENGIVHYICNICNINYKTYNGRWKHNKKYHSNNLDSNQHKINIYQHSNQHKINIYQHSDKHENNILECKNCKKIFSFIQSRWRHEKTCNKKDEIIELKNKLDQLEKKVNKKSNKKIINNTNNGTIINNNITINKIGTENLALLNDNEISQIFNKELESIITFIELLNFNERLPQNHSYCTTSLESKYLSAYNKETNTIEKDKKKYFFDKLLNTTIDQIQILYNSNKSLVKKNFNKDKQMQIENNIINLKSIKNYDFNNKILKEIINKMNLVSYNKKDIVQKTWHEDSDSDDDFQRELEKESKEEFYKKLEMKEKLALEKIETSSDTESSVKKLDLKTKAKPKDIPKNIPKEQADNDNNNIFLEISYD